MQRHNVSLLVQPQQSLMSNQAFSHECKLRCKDITPNSTAKLCNTGPKEVQLLELRVVEKDKKAPRENEKCHDVHARSRHGSL